MSTLILAMNRTAIFGSHLQIVRDLEEVRGEIDRYCAWPGQACGYKVGHTAINRLRAKAETELGDKFDFRRFNDAVVLGGSVPMTVLGRVIDDHIAREKDA